MDNHISDGDLREFDLSLMKVAVENSLNAIIITDPTQHIMYVNPAAEKICGFTAEEMLGRRPGELLQGPDSDPEVKDRVGKALREHRPVVDTILNYRKDGTPYWVEMQIVPVFDSVGGLTHFLSVEIDVTEHREMLEKIDQKANLLELANEILSCQTKELIQVNQTLERLSTTDALTGLGNHRLFQERITAYLDYHLQSETALSCALIDVDHFKSYNDTFGHLEGDAVLAKLGQILKGFVNDAGLAFRYGGEEFAMLFPGMDQDEVARRMEDLRAQIEGVDWPLRSITVSIGVSQTSTDIQTKAALFEAADKALYLAKEQGRNTVRVIEAMEPHDQRLAS